MMMEISMDERFCSLMESPKDNKHNDDDYYECLPGDDSFYEEKEENTFQENTKDYSLLSAMVEKTMGENFNWIKRGFPYDPVYMEDTVASILEKEGKQQYRINSGYMRHMLQLETEIREKGRSTWKSIKDDHRKMSLHWIFCVVKEIRVVGSFDNNILFKATMIFDMYCTHMAFHHHNPCHMNRKHLQLVVCACLELAITLDEGKGSPYDVLYGTLCYWADNSFTKRQLRDMSWKVSDALNFELEIANEYDFVDLFIVSHINDIEQKTQAFMEIKAGTMVCLYMMMLESVFIGFPPSVRVLASIAYTNIRLDEDPLSVDLIKWYKENAAKPSFPMLIVACMDKLYEFYDTLVIYDGECGIYTKDLLKDSFDRGIKRIEDYMKPGKLTHENYNQSKQSLFHILIH